MQTCSLGLGLVLGLVHFIFLSRVQPAEARILPITLFEIYLGTSLDLHVS